MITRFGVVAACILLVSAVLTVPTVAEDPPFYPDKTKLLVLRDGQGAETAIRTPDDWRRRRAHILANLQLVMGPLPDKSHKVPLDVQVEEEVRMDKFVRRKLTFAVEKGDRLPAYLLIPHERNGKLPAVLCLHTTHRELGGKIPAGIGSVDDRFAYAVHLAERGYVTLSPDYPYMGEYQQVDPYKLGYVSTTMKAVWNHMMCVDLLQSLAEVDPERIGAIGHSLGGHNSMFVAVFDERIKCVVSNAGFCSFPTYHQGNLKTWSNTVYMPQIRTVYELNREKVPFDFTDIVGALSPRAFLAIAPLQDRYLSSQGVKDCVTAAEPVYRLLGVPEKLAGNYPDCEHDFPKESRRVAYDWFDRWLKTN